MLSLDAFPHPLRSGYFLSRDGRGAVEVETPAQGLEDPGSWRRLRVWTPRVWVSGLGPQLGRRPGGAKHR